MNRKKIFAYIILLLIIALVIMLAIKWFTGSKQAQGMPPTVIQVFNVKTSDYQNTFHATGSLSSPNGITVCAEYSGRVTKIFFKPGEYVKEGAPLVQVYPNILEAKLKDAKAKLALSKLDYDRKAQLVTKHYISISALDAARANLESNQAVVDECEANLDLALVNAPFSGKVGLKQVSIGSYMSIGDPITDLESMDPLRADFSVPEVFIPQIHIGDTVEISSPAFQGVRKGKIYAFNSKVDPNSRYLDMRAYIPNKDQTLIPGSFIDVNILLGPPKKVFIVPQSVVVYDQQGSYVYKVENHKAIKTIITLGQKLDDDKMIVESGLKDGDVIVLGGQLKLYPGASVVTEQEAAAYFKAQMAQKKH